MAKFTINCKLPACPRVTSLIVSACKYYVPRILRKRINEKVIREVIGVCTCCQFPIYEKFYPINQNIINSRDYTLIVSASDDKTEVSLIEVFIDSKRVCSANNTSYLSCQIPARSLTLGTHKITIYAKDVFNNTGSKDIFVNVQSPYACRFIPMSAVIAQGASKKIEFECYNENGKQFCPGDNSTHFSKQVQIIPSNSLIVGDLFMAQNERENTSLYTYHYYYSFSVPKSVPSGNYIVVAYDRSTEMSCQMNIEVIDSDLFRCQIEPSVTQTISNEVIQVKVKYFNYTKNDSLVLFCKPGDTKLCLASGTGECLFSCTYIDAGNYNLVAYTPYQQCSFGNITVMVVDTVNPAVAILNPKDSSTISGQIVLKAIAQDNDQVKYIQLYFDNDLLKTSQGNELTFVVDTKDYRNGWHDITAVAFDRSNNKGFMKIRVYVFN